MLTQHGSRDSEFAKCDSPKKRGNGGAKVAKKKCKIKKKKDAERGKWWNDAVIKVTVSLWTYGLNSGSFEVTAMGLGSGSWHPFSGLLANNTNGLIGRARSSRQ